MGDKRSYSTMEDKRSYSIMGDKRSYSNLRQLFSTKIFSFLLVDKLHKDTLVLKYITFHL